MKVLCYPNEVLRTEARPVEQFDDALRETAAEMLETMHDANGVGLAAPQVGLSIRLVTLNTTGDPDGDLTLVNPEIVDRQGSATGEEGCLSFPGIFVNVRRAARVTLRYHDLDGAEQTIEADGLLARALQHELDHLEGVLLVDKMSPVQRMANRRSLKMLEARQARADERSAVR